MKKIKLYNVSDDYINFLRFHDSKVYSNKEDTSIHGRKYLGVVLQINNLNYFVPLSSPKDTDYVVRQGKKVIRKSIIPIIRIIAKDRSGKNELKGTLRFSNMIPVPNFALQEYDMKTEIDQGYKFLVLKELSFINDNIALIIKHADIIYKQKTNNYQNIIYLKNTVDFLLLEEKCKEYEQNQQTLIKSAKQVAAQKTQ